MDMNVAQGLYSAGIRVAKALRFVPKPILVMMGIVCAMVYGVYLIVSHYRSGASAPTHRPASTTRSARRRVSTPRPSHGGIHYHTAHSDVNRVIAMRQQAVRTPVRV